MGWGGEERKRGERGRRRREKNGSGRLGGEEMKRGEVVREEKRGKWKWKVGRRRDENGKREVGKLKWEAGRRGRWEMKRGRAVS